MAMATGVGSTMLSRLPVALPFILIAAAANAFIEEFVFRSVMLARLSPILGGQQANWLQTILFGLSHYFGTPSGPLGVLMSGFLGWLNGKSMLESRGFTIAFILHFAQDAVIFAFFVLSLA